MEESKREEIHEWTGDVGTALARPRPSPPSEHTLPDSKGKGRGRAKAVPTDGLKLSLRTG
jgi:hypothetical protein